MIRASSHIAGGQEIHKSGAQVRTLNSPYSISQYTMLRCCSQCPRTSSPSGLSRHRKTCKIYRQSIDSSLRPAQYAEHTRSIAIRTGLQVNQEGVGVEAVEGSKTDTEWIQTDITVSSTFIIFPHMLLTRCYVAVALYL
jgi:hypothetical protein